MAEVQKQIFLWYGDNDFDVQQTVQQWIKVFEKKYTGLNVVTLDAMAGGSKDALLQEVKNSLQVDSLFGSNKLIVLRNFLAAKTKDPRTLEVLETMLSRLTATFFVVLAQTDKPDARTKVFKGIKKLEKEGRAEIKEFHLPRGYELNRWVEQRAQLYKTSIDRNAVELLVALVGNNLWQLDSELQKLCAYSAGAGGQRPAAIGQVPAVTVISEQAVKDLVKARFNDDIFQLMDALSQKDKATAMRLMHDQLDSGASEMYLLAMLVRQFRLLRQVKELFASGVRDKSAIARQLKIHPFVVQKILGQINRFEFVQLRSIYQELLQLEFYLKSENTSFRVLFDNFVAVL